MKCKNGWMVITTLTVVIIGSIAFVLSIFHMKENAQMNLSGMIEAKAYDSTDIFIETETFNESKKDPSIVYLDKDGMNGLPTGEMSEVVCTTGVYKGQNISIMDGLVDKETAWNNAIQIIDYVYDVVDAKLLTPYSINKSEYSYSIQRQYQKQDGNNYGVFLIKEEKIVCTIGICLETQPKITSFSRDGVVDMYGGDTIIPSEYIVKNWCSTIEQRETIYDQYYDVSRNIIENVLGLQAIIRDVKNVDSSSYFSADDDWSMVTFGYVLEDGMYVKIFYNRVNQKWVGFVIAGYHKEYI